MALDGPTEASAVAQQGIVTQGGHELCKFAKVLGVELELVCMAEEKLEIAEVHIGDFEMECFLPMLLKVVIGFIGSLLGL